MTTFCRVQAGYQLLASSQSALLVLSADLTHLNRVCPCVLTAAAVVLGSTPEQSLPLHNARYCFNDEILLTGARYFAEVVRRTPH